MPTKIDWSTLSPRSLAIARQIGTRLSEGYSPTEIGIEFGTSTRWVLTRIVELRRELEAGPSVVATPVDGSETTPGPHRQCI
jgi:hypothetical protein